MDRIDLGWMQLKPFLGSLILPKFDPRGFSFWFGAKFEGLNLNILM